MQKLDKPQAMMPSTLRRSVLTSGANLIASATASSQAAFLAQLSCDELAALPYLFDFWALPHQLPPHGDWRTWVILGGRGAGKTRAGAEWVRAMVEGPTPHATGRAARVGLVAETMDQAREVMVFGDSGIMSVCPPDRRPGRATLIRMQADTDLRLRLSLAALAVISGLTWHKLAHQPDGDLHITILDVGEGDAVLLRSPNGGSSPIQLTDLLSRYTSIFERELDWLIIGGTAYDQVGGLTRLSDHFVIRHSLIPRSSGKGSFQRVLEDLDESSTPKTIYEPGHRLALGQGAFLEFLSVSDSGALIMVQWYSARFLLAPGADPDLIHDSLDDPRLRSVSAVLLPAGGYAAVNPDEWLRHLNPGVILLSLRTGEMPAELPKNISSPLLNRSRWKIL